MSVWAGFENRAAGENIEYRMMPPRTECDSTFPWSLKEIPGINDRPLLRTDQKHARTKTVLGGAGQSSMFARETTEKTRMFHLTASPPKQNAAGRCGPIEHARTLETTQKTRMFHLTASPPPRFSTRFRKNRHRAPRARAIRSQHLLIFT